jgi:hypothetical protein
VRDFTEFYILDAPKLQTDIGRRGAIYRALLAGWCVTGRNKLRPYSDDNVDVIGHDHERVDRNLYKSVRNTAPHFVYDPPGLTQLNIAVHNITEQASPLVRHDRNEIQPRLGIIEFL